VHKSKRTGETVENPQLAGVRTRQVQPPPETRKAQKNNRTRLQETERNDSKGDRQTGGPFGGERSGGGGPNRSNATPELIWREKLRSWGGIPGEREGGGKEVRNFWPQMLCWKGTRRIGGNWA